MTQESRAEKARRTPAERAKRDDCIQPDQAAMGILLENVAALRKKRAGFAQTQTDGEEALRHYSIVAAMLDPKGPHGLGNKPLKAFFDTVFPGAREYILQENDCIVENEYSIRDRQMLVVIRNRTLCAAIEIDLTSSNPARLKATEEWLIRRPEAHKILFYLTWPGNFTSDPTLLQDGYFAISFRRDIRDWIMKCSLAAWEKNYSSVHEFCHRYCSCLQETMHYPYCWASGKYDSQEAKRARPYPRTLCQ